VNLGLRLKEGETIYIKASAGGLKRDCGNNSSAHKSELCPFLPWVLVIWNKAC